jgi:hypothetical protein
MVTDGAKTIPLYRGSPAITHRDKLPRRDFSRFLANRDSHPLNPNVTNPSRIKVLIW